jgi:hypothetical protein
MLMSGPLMQSPVMGCPSATIHANVKSRRPDISPTPKTGGSFSSPTGARPMPAFPPVIDLHRPIFTHGQACFPPFGACFAFPEKHATDVLAISAEKWYQAGQTEAEMAPDGRYSEKGCSLTEGITEGGASLSNPHQKEKCPVHRCT